MPDATLHPESPAATAADLRARAAFDQQLWMLGRLAQAGLNMALALESQALAIHPEAAGDQGPQPYGAPVPAPVSLDFLPPSPGDLALAFTRVSRAVRMTIALQARLLKAEAGGPHALAARAPAPAPAETRPQRAARAGAIVRRLIAGCEDDGFEAMELMERAQERLADRDITGDLLDRPIPELIAGICHDLGLSPDWAALQGEAWMADAAHTSSLLPAGGGSRQRPGGKPDLQRPPPVRPAVGHPPTGGREEGVRRTAPRPQPPSTPPAPVSTGRTS
jgi:hypothetical protein